MEHEYTYQQPNTAAAAAPERSDSTHYGNQKESITGTTPMADSSNRSHSDVTAASSAYHHYGSGGGTLNAAADSSSTMNAAADVYNAPPTATTTTHVDSDYAIPSTTNDTVPQQQQQQQQQQLYRTASSSAANYATTTTNNNNTTQNNNGAAAAAASRTGSTVLAPTAAGAASSSSATSTPATAANTVATNSNASHQYDIGLVRSLARMSSGIAGPSTTNTTTVAGDFHTINQQQQQLNATNNNMNSNGNINMLPTPTRPSAGGGGGGGLGANRATTMLFSPNARDVSANAAASRQMHELAQSSPLVARAVIAGGAGHLTTTTTQHYPSAMHTTSTTIITIDDDRQRMLRTAAHAQDALTDRNAKITAAERSLAQFSSVCQRSSARAEERIAAHEDSLSRATTEKGRQEALLLELQNELAKARRGLSQYQTAVEDDRKALEATKAAFAAAKRAEEECGVEQKGARARALREQKAAEDELSSLQQQLAALHDGIASLNSAAVEERQHHSDRLVATRSEVTNVRRQQSDATAAIQSLRKALAEATGVEEEAVRRANKVEAELDEEAAMAKRIAMQDECAANDEAMRELRTRTETAHDNLRAQSDAARVQLLAEEKSLSAALDEQNALQLAIDGQQTLLSALSAVDGRNTAAEENLKALVLEVTEQQEQLVDYNNTLVAAEERVAALKDTVAPTQDVTDSVRDLRTAIDNTRTALADAQTQHGVMGATRDEQLRTVNQSRLEAERVVKAKRVEIDESNEDTLQTSEAIKTQLRVLEVETATMEDNIRSLLHRNQTLANSLEEIDRHRKALEETLFRQKEEARRAAQALLMQLESQ